MNIGDSPGGKMIKTYGLLEPEDAWILSQAVDVWMKMNETITILEIGFRDGDTARGIHDFLGDKHHDYWCIDNDRDVPTVLPFEGAHSVKGDSAEVFDQVPDDLHLVIIDGCHCVNHVVLDFMHYGKKVASGGFVFFHDTTLPMQGKSYQGHGPDIPSFRVGVREAIDFLQPILEKDWDLIAESVTPWRGARLYQKRTRVPVLRIERAARVDTAPGKE